MNSVDMLKSVLGNEHSLASEIANLYTKFYSARREYDRRVEEVVQFLYATSTLETSNAGNNHEHTTHRPKLTQIYDNLKANYMSGLMPNDGWFTFEGDDEQSVDKNKRRLLEGYLRTKHRQSKFRAKASELVDDWLLGNAFAQVVYVNETHKLDNGQEVQGYRGPKVIRIAPQDIVFNIFATSFEESPKIVRSIKTLGQVARDIEERPDLGYMKDVFDKIVEVRATARQMKQEDIDKARQAEYDGLGSYSQYITGDLVEFLEFYGDIYDTDTNTLYKNHCITVVDRMYVIRKQPCPTWNGRPAIFHARYRKRRGNLMGMGALENLIGMQYYINHLENSRADAFDEMLLPDRVIVGDVEEVIEGGKGEKTYYVATGGSVQNLAPDATVLNADFKIDEIENKMELYAGAPREAMGIRSPGEKTAFEVETLTNASGRFFQFNMTQLESEFFENIINAELMLAKQHLGTSSEMIRLEDPTTGAVVFETVTAEDLAGNGKLVPVGARHYARKRQLAQNLIQLQQTVLQSDPEMALHFPSVRMAEIWEELLEFEQYRLMQPYGRIPEQLQAQRLISAANRSLEEEEMINPEEDLADEQPVD